MRLPEWIPQESRILPSDFGYISAKIDNIVNRLGNKHLSWWEHKGSNQCQICDLIVICIKMREQLYTTKSSLDGMNDTSVHAETGLDWSDVEDEDNPYLEDEEDAEIL